MEPDVLRTQQPPLESDATASLDIQELIVKHVSSHSSSTNKKAKQSLEYTRQTERVTEK